MDFEKIWNDPDLTRDLAVNLASEIVGAIILVAIIGSGIAYVSERRQNAKRKKFMLRFLRHCEVTIARLFELLNVWSRPTGGYRNPSVEERAHEIVLWRADYVQEGIETASRIADFSAPVIDINDLRDQFEVLAGLWRIEGEIRRLKNSVSFDGGASINKRRESIGTIVEEKGDKYPEFWEALVRLMDKWKYRAYAESLQDPYSNEIRHAANLEHVLDAARRRRRRR